MPAEALGEPVLVAGSSAGTELWRSDRGWMLKRNGEEFLIKGVGGHERLADAAALGANSIRTWDGENIGWLLDEAASNNLLVTVGIWLEHPRHGFDYADPTSRAKQLEKIKRIVTQYRDHPAVLMWAAGNEVELMIEADAELAKAWRSVEEGAALIKQLDPTRPVLAIVSELGWGGEKVKAVAERCPSVDIIGINSYGGAANLATRYLELGHDLPYILTEFGTLGPWEVGQTSWGAPYEPTSTEKADRYAAAYAENVGGDRAEGHCLGTYAFVWGHKQEATGTWFGMLLETGEMTASAEAASMSWTGKMPKQRAPVIEKLHVDVDLEDVKRGRAFEARIDAHDPNGDPLDVAWEVRRESSDRRAGGDAEAVPELMEGKIVSADGLTATVRASDQPGAYRLFAVVRDGTGRAGTANVPFRIVDE